VYAEQTTDAEGTGVQAEKQQRYVRLIAQGVNNSEACRLVGINRKTGNR
jgi:transposase, IS30 family